MKEIDFTAGPYLITPDEPAAAQANAEALELAVLDIDTGGRLLLPPGRICLSKSRVYTTAYPYHNHDVTVRGDDDNRTTFVFDESGDDGSSWWMFRVRECHGWIFEQFDVDGQKAILSNAPEQTHFLRANQAHGLTVRDVHHKNIAGDFAKLIETKWPMIEWVSGDSPGRSHITVQRGTQGAVFRNLDLRGSPDQAIDFEPTGVTDNPDTWVRDILIEDVHVHDHPGLYGISLSACARVHLNRVKLEGCDLYIVHADDILIDDSDIVGTQDWPDSPVVRVFKDSERVAFRRTRIKGGPDKDGIKVHNQAGSAPSDVTVEDCRIEAGLALSAVGGTRDVRVRRNRLVQVPGNSDGLWFACHSDNSPGFIVEDNQIEGFTVAARVVAGDTDVDRVVAQRNRGVRPGKQLETAGIYSVTSYSIPKWYR